MKNISPTSMPTRLSALTTSQRTTLFDAWFVMLLDPCISHSPGYKWACSVTVELVQILVGSLNHRFLENYSLMSQTILRLLHKLLTTYTLLKSHHRALFLRHTKLRRSSPESTALSEWSVYWDNFMLKLSSMPNLISNVLRVTSQLGSRTDQGLDPFQGCTFFQL